MKDLRINLIAFILICFFLSSCKAYRNLENITPKVSKETQAGPFEKSELKKLIPGDRITVNATTGFKYYMVYQNYTGNMLVGSVWKVNDEKFEIPQRTEIPFEEIDHVLVRRVSAAATTPLVALGAVVLSFGILVILMSSGDGFWQN